MKQHKDCNFSYAGLKTQVRLAIESQNMYINYLKISFNQSNCYFIPVKLLFPINIYL